MPYLIFLKSWPIIPRSSPIIPVIIISAIHTMTIILLLYWWTEYCYSADFSSESAWYTVLLPSWTSSLSFWNYCLLHSYPLYYARECINIATYYSHCIMSVFTYMDTYTYLCVHIKMQALHIHTYIHTYV